MTSFRWGKQLSPLYQNTEQKFKMHLKVGKEYIMLVFRLKYICFTVRSTG